MRNNLPVIDLILFVPATSRLYRVIHLTDSLVVYREIKKTSIWMFGYIYKAMCSILTNYAIIFVWFDRNRNRIQNNLRK